MVANCFQLLCLPIYHAISVALGCFGRVARAFVWTVTGSNWLFEFFDFLFWLQDSAHACHRSAN